MKRIFCFLLLLSILALAACDTVEYPGRGAGSAISETASGDISAATESEASGYPEEHGSGIASEESRIPSKASPLFYKATSGEGGVLYLFGSIHAADESAYPLPESIMKAYENSDYLAVEADIGVYESDLTAQTQLIGKMLCAPGTKIYDYIGNELYEKAKKILSEAGFYSSYLDYYDMTLWFNLLDSLAIETTELSADYGIDKFFLSDAHDNGKEIIELESVEEQYDILLNFSNELKLLLLSDVIENFDLYAEELNSVYSLWKSGDEQSAADTLQSEAVELDESELALYNEYNEAMMTARNIKMTQKAEELLKNTEKTGFLVVGLAHIIGADGIVASLRDKGYAVERIKG